MDVVVAVVEEQFIRAALCIAITAPGCTALNDQTLFAAGTAHADGRCDGEGGLTARMPLVAAIAFLTLYDLTRIASWARCTHIDG